MRPSNCTPCWICAARSRPLPRSPREAFADVCWLDQVPIEPERYAVMDRGYIDFRRLRRIAQGGAFFVIRERPDVQYYTAESRAVDRTTVLRSDQVIRFNGSVASRLWPERMRRVSIYDATHQRHFGILDQPVGVASSCVIAELYRQRWQIELFFVGSKKTCACARSAIRNWNEAHRFS